ncbi:hypothetical protein H106_00037 [Trichophyton rubrum CBS 735.88]|nr:hypothetical protein H106_00037 [Trichophyton rubrum CBS 735.88]
MVVVKLLACTLSVPWSTQLGCSASHGWRWMHASSVPKPAAVQPTASDRSSLGLLASPYATLVKLLDGEVNRANLAAKLHALPLVLRNEYVEAADFIAIWGYIWSTELLLLSGVISKEAGERL